MMAVIVTVMLLYCTCITATAAGTTYAFADNLDKILVIGRSQLVTNGVRTLAHSFSPLSCKHPSLTAF